MYMKSLAIEREFGSGGREIGMRVAETAGIPYYDGELIVKAAEAQGVSLDLLKEYDEQHSGKILYDIALLANYNQSTAKQSNIYELLYGIQNTIEKLERKGPAVFIGRCSTEILRQNPQVIRAYIYSSDEEKKRRRLVKTENITEAEVKKVMEKVDRQRRNYFKFWTQKDWSDRRNYDLELNTAAFSMEECAELLLDLMQK